MVTPRPAARLYITEWFKALKTSDAKVAEALGTNRETVFRWRKEPWRLDPQKIMQLAEVLEISPQRLWYPPNRESIDDMLEEADDDTREMAADLIKRLLKKKA